MKKGGGKLNKGEIFYFTILPFIISIAVASFLSVQLNTHVILFLLFISLLLLISLREKKIKVMTLVIAFLLLGFWRYQVAPENINDHHIAYYNGTKKELEVMVDSDVLKKKGSQSFVVKVEGNELKGRIMVYTDAYPDYLYGDVLKLKCELEKPKPFKDFSYDRFLAMKGIYSICFYGEMQLIKREQGTVLKTLAFGSKNNIRNIIDRGLEEPEASLAKAIILGDAKSIDQDLRSTFSNLGISHIIAISGMHTAIIAAIIAFILFLIGLSRDQVFYVSSLLLAVFIFMVGIPTSAMRAGLMCVLAMYALKEGRGKNLLRVILFTAFVLLLINPNFLRDDIGFQLSFVAILGMFYIKPLLDCLLISCKIPNAYKLRELISLTMSAQLACNGFVMYYFGTLSLIAVLTNVLVLWSLPFILALLIFAISYSLLLGVNLYIFFPAYVLLRYILLVSDFFANMIFAYLSLEVGELILFFYYLSLIVVVLFFGRLRKNKRANLILS